MARIVLASGSPRRRELLRLAGFEFEVRAADVDESVLAGETPAGYVERLAREKAEAVFRELSLPSADLALPPLRQKKGARMGHGGEGGDEERVVLGADTTVVLDGEILGKPLDEGDARRMLRGLSGRAHTVLTGVAVASASGTEAAVEVTEVWFREISEAEIDAYVATGEPMDKAGAYGIQGRAARWIPRIEGCYFNVMGLPVARVCLMLSEHCEGVGNRE